MDLFEPETKNIKGVQFSIMSPDEIRERSVVEVTKYDTYDKEVPVVKGLFDIRMGTTEMGRICGTCQQKNIDCPGHFGHLELAIPVYHYHFINQIPKILKCVCLNCSKLLIIFPLVSPLTPRALISSIAASAFLGSKVPLDISPSNNNSFNFL